MGLKSTGANPFSNLGALGAGASGGAGRVSFGGGSPVSNNSQPGAGGDLSNPTVSKGRSRGFGGFNDVAEFFEMVA